MGPLARFRAWRHARRLRAALDAYELALERVRDAGELKRIVQVDTDVPVSARAEAALPQLRDGLAAFRAACARVDAGQAQLARLVAGPQTLSPQERRRIGAANERHPTKEALVTVERKLAERIAKYEAWARAPQSRGHRTVKLDERDAMHPGWWHGP